MLWRLTGRSASRDSRKRQTLLAAPAKPGGLPRQLDDDEAPAGYQGVMEVGGDLSRVSEMVIDTSHENGVATSRRQVRRSLSSRHHGHIGQSGLGHRFSNVVEAPATQLSREDAARDAHPFRDFNAQPASAGADLSHRQAIAKLRTLTRRSTSPSRDPLAVRRTPAKSATSAPATANAHARPLRGRKRERMAPLVMGLLRERRLWPRRPSNRHNAPHRPADLRNTARRHTAT